MLDRLEDSVRVFEIVPSLPLPISDVQLSSSLDANVVLRRRGQLGPLDAHEPVLEGTDVDSEAPEAPL